MDSVTQFTLGAAIGVAALSPTLGVRKAAVIGGALGTLPDLDVLVPFDDPIDTFTLHRGPSHSFYLHALFAVPIGEGLRRLFTGLRALARWQVYAVVLAVFWSHALIDLITVYGTRVLWPLPPDAFGVGSMFIIDPIFTLPMLVLTIWAVIGMGWNARARRATWGTLTFTAAYLGWSMLAQQWASQRALTALADAPPPREVLALATPFNTGFWRVIALYDDRYLNVYVPLFGGPEDIVVHAHPRTAAVCLDDATDRDRLVAFADGYVRTDVENGELVVSDLRMGLTGGYVFRFAIADVDGTTAVAKPPQRRDSLTGQRAFDGDWDWLIGGFLGRPGIRPVEAAARLSPAAEIVTRPRPTPPC